MYKLIETVVGRGLSRRNGLRRLRRDISDSPLVVKYDPEDFGVSGNRKVSGLEEVLMRDEVGAVQVGGSTDIDAEKVKETVSRIKNASPDVLTMLEPGGLEHVGEDMEREVLRRPDILNKPSVWNTSDTEWVNGHARRAQRALVDRSRDAEEMVGEEAENVLSRYLPGKVSERAAEKYVEGSEGIDKLFRRFLDSKVVPEMYYVLNPDCAVARKTGADEDVREKSLQLLEDDIRGLVGEAAQNGFEGIIYLESSGKLSSPELVEAARDEIRGRGIESDVLLAYGGGIGGNDVVSRDRKALADLKERSPLEQASQYLEAGADFVIVGDAVQQEGEDFFRGELGH
ncbi:MAG: hypothetical protein ABEJ98_00800 [Candidatus Nanohaloarchaea archaeon]